MSTDVRVVTFNAAAGNPKIKTVETEFLDLPFYREALEDAPGAPVLALQEVGSGQARALRERARGAPCQVLQKRRPGLGNALVVPARYRVLRARRRYFVLSQLRGTIDGLRWWAKEGHKPNWRQFGELRMWVEARVRDRVTEREFTVLTTHLSVEPSLKRRQADQVVRRARRAARRGPVVLAGDFNVPANPRGRDVEIAAILGRLKDAGSAQPGRRPNIDYVLTDGFEPVSSKVWMGDSLSLPSSPTAELISDHYAEDDVLRFRVPRGAGRGAGQVAFGARATIRRDRVDDARTALAALAGPGAFATAFPFALMDGVHFGRLLIIDDELDPDGVLVPASLLYMSEVDAPLARHLQQLTTIAGPALDGVFSLCEGYPDAPDPAARLAFLEAAYLPAQARYVNTVGRTCRQVLDEAYLREAIQAFLDRERFDLPADVQGVRRAIQQFVVDEPSLAWARHRAPRPPLRFRVGEALHFLATVALLVVLTPLLAVVLPIWALVLRYHEARDPAPYVPVPAEHTAELFAIEDFVTQNQFNAIGWVKPGWFRRTTIIAVLTAIDFAARHVFRRADLAGVKSIHFARWTMLEDGRRAIFTSYYDGSLESYMDDFIDKVAFGLNASFSHAVGYPRTRFLFFSGAKREEEFKALLRNRQIPTQVWYSAYPHLSAPNVNDNALIRSGLFGAMSDKDAETWLRRL